MFRFAQAALLALITATAAQAQEVRVNFLCDLGGAPAQMAMFVHYQNAFGISVGPTRQISGVFPTGVNVYTAGQVSSHAATYTFRGENQFADFVDHTTGQRFRVEWVLDAGRNGVWMRVNPFGDTATYFCAYKGLG